MFTDLNLSRCCPTTALANEWAKGGNTMISIFPFLASAAGHEPVKMLSLTTHQ